MVEFINGVAWVFGTLSFLLLILRIIAWAWYHSESTVASLRRLDDSFRGIDRTFPITIPGIVFLVCLIWLLST